MIQFENIRSGEVVTFKASQDAAARTAQIAAYLNSSDMSPNALKGQDFGWRLSPEIKDEMERIKGDFVVLETISKRIGVAIDELRDFHILNYIVEQTFQKEALADRQAGNNLDERAREEDYQARLKALRDKREATTYNEQAPVAPAPVTVAQAADAVATPAAPVAEESTVGNDTTAPVAGELDLPGVTDEPVIPQVDNTEAAKPAEDATEPNYAE